MSSHVGLDIAPRSHLAAQPALPPLWVCQCTVVGPLLLLRPADRRPQGFQAHAGGAGACGKAAAPSPCRVPSPCPRHQPQHRPLGTAGDPRREPRRHGGCVARSGHAGGAGRTAHGRRGGVNARRAAGAGPDPRSHHQTPARSPRRAERVDDLAALIAPGEIARARLHAVHADLPGQRQLASSGATRALRSTCGRGPMWEMTSPAQREPRRAHSARS